MHLDDTRFDPATYRPKLFHDKPATLAEAINQWLTGKHLSQNFMELAELLIWRNPASMKCVEGPDEAPERLTEEQRVLAALFMLDLDVQNGGLSQFFWNRECWVQHAAVALDAVGCNHIADLMRSDITRVLDYCGSIEAYADGGAVEDYAEQAATVEFGKFESAYYDSDTERYTKAIEYVRTHLKGFLRPS